MLTYTYDEFLQDVKQSAAVLREQLPEVCYVYGVPRGGLVFAVYLSHFAGYRMLPPNYILSHDFPRTKVIVVDDICDTGATIQDFDNLGYMTMTLHYKLRACAVPTFFAHVVDDEEWVTYPWENSEKAEADQKDFVKRRKPID
jgi:hypoxanthine phosphoribosyltransferase